jgi:hypothetical protein
MTLRLLQKWSYLASEFLVLYLYNKSTIVKHHFTICRLSEFVYSSVVMLSQWLEGAKVQG